MSHNAALTVALDKLRRRCPHCGHEHFAVRCHICKTLDPSYLGIGAADQPAGPSLPKSTRLEKRISLSLVVVAACLFGAALAVAAAMVQLVLERVAG